MQVPSYIGRFAPSPTGPLNFGSVVAALGSYLQAKQQQGLWRVRMEDIDQPRTVAGADKLILEQMEQLGLGWDGEVIYQSQRTGHYQHALELLQQADLVFRCYCSRKEIGDRPYPGTCRTSTTSKNGDYAIRVKVEQEPGGFIDRIQGAYQQSIQQSSGDFVIKRKEGLFAYQLAVVVDDADQQITEIVRGADLIDSSCQQIYLQQLLGFQQPAYVHLPVAQDQQGNKISKQDGATAIDLRQPGKILVNVLDYLGQNPPTTLSKENVSAIIQWAVEHWDISLVPRARAIRLGL
mgnify:CR=1 FL=1